MGGKPTTNRRSPFSQKTKKLVSLFVCFFGNRSSLSQLFSQVTYHHPLNSRRRPHFGISSAFFVVVSLKSLNAKPSLQPHPKRERERERDEHHHHLHDVVGSWGGGEDPKGSGGGGGVLLDTSSFRSKGHQVVVVVGDQSNR